MRPLPPCLLVLCSVMCVMACERTADVSSPQRFDKHGISFSYPGNWGIESDTTDPMGFRTIIVETPGDGVAMIQHFKETPSMNLEDYAKLFSEMAREEVPFGEFSPSEFKPYTYTQKPANQQLAGVQERFDMMLLGEHVPHVRGFFGFDERYPRTVFICQVASEDLSKVRPGCDQILDQLAVSVP